MISSDLVMIGYYDYRLATLSVLISILDAYAARDLSERVRDSRGRAWLIWLVCGAKVDGISTWSLQYTETPALYLSFSDGPRKLCAKFSLSNCAWLTTGRSARWLRS